MNSTACKRTALLWQSDAAAAAFNELVCGKDSQRREASHFSASEQNQQKELNMEGRCTAEKVNVLDEFIHTDGAAAEFSRAE